MRSCKHLLIVGSISAACAATSSFAATECLVAGNTIEMQSCFLQKQKEAEATLNTTYQVLISLSTLKIDAESENDLRRAERSWVEFRKLNCQFYESKDRALHGLEASDCMLRMTREREAELKAAVDELSNR